MRSNRKANANLRERVLISPTSGKTFSVLAAALAFSAMLFALAPKYCEAQTSEIEGSAEQNAEIKAAADVPVKWLPDLRVLTGAPETEVDLDRVAKELCEQNYLGADASPADIEWNVAQNTKSSVAELKLDGEKLFVHWNNDIVGKSKVVLQANVKGNEDRKAYASFTAESWAPNYTHLLMAILGGLGLFLLGMKNMTSGLTAIAGANLRRMISFFTDNRFAAVGVGIATTTLVQSSSATSVMALGFVDSGLMTLTQAINVIIGTNIGTTTTGWLLTFKIGALGLPILGLSALALVFTKKELVKHWATFLLGFGMIFFGLEVLKGGMEPLSELPEFSAFIQSIKADSLANVGKGILVGTLATMLVQSSAVTLAIAITLATLGSIDLNSAIALILGSNIGTTITAFLASIGAGSNARRAAYFHIFFNVVGVLWFWPIFFTVLIPTVHVVGDMCGLESDVSKIALTHSIFNLANTVVFLPFTNRIAALLQRFVKDDKKTEKQGYATDLRKWVNKGPTVGLSYSRTVVQRMFLSCRALVVDLSELHNNNFDNEELIKHNFEVEAELDKVQDETIEFVVTMTRNADTAALIASAHEQIRLAQELETISDYLTGVLKSYLKLKNENKQKIPASVDSCVAENLQTIAATLDNLTTLFEKHIHNHLAEPMKAQRDRSVVSVKSTRDAFQQEMVEKQYDPAVIAAVDYQLNAIRRMYEHLLNIAEAMEGPGKPIKGKTPIKITGRIYNAPSS